MTEPRGLQALAEFPAHDRCLEICRDAGMPGFGAGSSITRGRFEAYEVLYNIVQNAAAERQRLMQPGTSQDVPTGELKPPEAPVPAMPEEVATSGGDPQAPPEAEAPSGQPSSTRRRKRSRKRR
jgi:hypothetical protein